MFDKAQEILKRRGKSRAVSPVTGKREKFSRQYAFSCMLECGFCGSNLSRRSWHSSSQHQKTIWQCVTGTKKGKQFCPDSKGIPESVIEEAFIESYRLLCGDNRDVLDEFIQRVESTLGESKVKKQLGKVDKEISKIDDKKKKLLDMRLEEQLDKATYSAKMDELEEQRNKLLDQRVELQLQSENEKTLKRRTMEFKKALEQNRVLEEFDRTVFESIVEKVIVGEIDENGNKNPYKLTFVYKTGLSNKVDSKAQRDLKIGKTVKENLQKLCSHVSDEVNGLCSKMRVDKCGDGMPIVQTSQRNIDNIIVIEHAGKTKTKVCH